MNNPWLVLSVLGNCCLILVILYQAIAIKLLRDDMRAMRRNARRWVRAAQGGRYNQEGQSSYSGKSAQIGRPAHYNNDTFLDELEKEDIA